MAVSEVGGAGDLQPGTMRPVQAAGHDLLLARVGDQYYAAERHCPHLGGDLAAGRLAGTVVTCPRHGSQFDLADGRVVRWTNWTGLKLALARRYKRPRPLRTYPVRIEKGRMLVDL